jgi:hypothetical protein
MTVGQPFIGREIERKLLHTLARRAFDGGGSVVLISGEAGIGKSTLVQAALAESGLAVRNGRARRDDEDGWAEALPADADIESLASQRPLAVVLEDMQWAAAHQLTRLPATTRRLIAASVMLIIVYRDDELGAEHPLRPLRAQLRHEGSPTEIVLGPFGASEVAAFCHAAHGRRAPPALLLDAVLLRSGGVPLFVAELAAAWGSAGDLPDAADDLPTPERLRDAVLLRAAVLDESARRELSMVALLKSDGVPSSVFGFVEELLGCGLVLKTSAGELCFRHQLARDVIRDAIPRSRRAGLHTETGNPAR